ncbi:MAG: ribonuclease H-like domain-containing protein [Alphaproteobacteria bacterium]|nr:ribonuclease H-like domain-containing protein [Alphaproteobacteria bacterium]MDN5248823.1 ribonuclease H-like domain-containing protein [Alphaproteobacteria bacterium]
MSKIRLHKGDLPSLELYDVNAVAIDTETMGLSFQRDRLCLIQLSPGDGSVDIVQIAKDAHDAPNLLQLLRNNNIVKIFHYARFDLGAIANHFEIMPQNSFCTKIASKLCRTYSSRHGLKELCSELLNVQISKQQQSSDWGSQHLSQAQLDYAASDVLYLHQLRDILTAKLQREDRFRLAKACFEFLPMRVLLDLEGWAEQDIFAHA